jgi:hypothetical protein
MSLSSSGGRGRLPACVVMKRSVLAFIVVLPDYFLVGWRARMGNRPKGPEFNPASGPLTGG